MAFSSVRTATSKTLRLIDSMSGILTTLEYSADRVAERKRRLEEQRDKVRDRYEQGATGLQVASLQSSLLDEWIAGILEESLNDCPAEQQAFLRRYLTVIAVGGTGRGELAPYSDCDLLFLYASSAETAAAEWVSAVVREFWDCGLKLGHSVRTPADALRMARQDAHFATSLTDARRLWGAEPLAIDFLRRFGRSAVGSRRRAFAAEAITARESERQQFGGSTQQLEPDVKCSPGGLRDIHLIRWVGFAFYGTSDLNSLKLRGGLSPDEALALISATDYLTHIRIGLHLTAGKPQDVLTRDEQLRFARERGVTGTAGQRPVERFMQEFFRHTTAVAEISRRFLERHQRPPLARRLLDFVMTYRVDDIYRIGPEYLDVPYRFRERVCGSPEGVLKLYLAAARYRVKLAPHLEELIARQVKTFPADLSAEASRAFLGILGTTGILGAILRSMHAAGVLEYVLPPLRHIRCLLQFNQYHHYTVDEHTLRAVEAAESFEKDSGPVGQAYRAIRHKELLHLSLLLHDAGKGFEEDHCTVGWRLAQDLTVRLGLPEHQRELVSGLILQHLQMTNLGLRRDTSDPEVLLRFSHDIGSAEALRMLYVHTAADMSAVGPGVWNEWKSDLVTSLYERSLLWLSGKSYLFDEPTRLERARNEVLECVAETDEKLRQALIRLWKDRLKLFPPHYLLATPPERIAADLRIVCSRAPEEIHIESRYEPETATTEYRIITDERVGSGCFHKLTGTLTAKRMEILSAQICTSQDGVIIDAYRVKDFDHSGEVPQFRIDEVSDLIRAALKGDLDVYALFQARTRFQSLGLQGPVSNLPLRVVIDNESSDRYTVVDVFAHDRPGLLYTIARALYSLDASVVLAKISTHFDQVVDVFYLADADGGKVRQSLRLKLIRDTLIGEIAAFEERFAGR